MIFDFLDSASNFSPDPENSECLLLRYWLSCCIAHSLLLKCAPEVVCSKWRVSPLSKRAQGAVLILNDYRQQVSTKDQKTAQLWM